MLVQYIAERLNENPTEHYNWILGENYDFLYTPQDAESFEDILAADKQLGHNSFEITVWNGYKLYHNTDERITDTFYIKCPSGKMFFFSTYYKNSGRSCKLLFPQDRNFNNW